MNRWSNILVALAVSVSVTSAAWAPPRRPNVVLQQRLKGVISVTTTSTSALFSLDTKSKPSNAKGSSTTSSTTDEQEATEKYGLEVGLFQSLKKKDGGESAKSLLKRYGIAYLATSIPLALISFTICYLLVDSGVDVGALLAKVGIESDSTKETAGTLAIAYAAHKAASPIRFPPTVILTPLVAKAMGKEPNEGGESSPPADAP